MCVHIISSHLPAESSATLYFDGCDLGLVNSNLFVVLLWRPAAGTRALVVGGIGMSRKKFES